MPAVNARGYCLPVINERTPRRACSAPVTAGAATGAAPSAAALGLRRFDAARQRVVARQDPVCQRDLPSLSHAQLEPERVAMRLRGARRDPKCPADLVIRATRGDQLDHLLLPRGNRGWIPECLH